MNDAQWSGVVRLGIAALVWVAMIGGAWLWYGKPPLREEDEESTGGFWQR